MRPHRHENVTAGGKAVALSFVLMISVSCSASRVNVVRPPLAAAFHESFNISRTAQALVVPSDPDMCPAKENPDPQEMKIGGLSTRSVYQFQKVPRIDNLYARLVVITKVCTDSTLSPSDRDAFTKVLNFLKIANAKSFASTVIVTGDGQGGVKFPTLVPFSYSYDEGKTTYSVQTIGKGVVPWQVTSAFEIQYAYNANKTLSINTSSLFTSISTTLAGAGGGSALLSKAANAYLSAGTSILQNVAQSVFTDINTGNDTYHFDVLQDSDRAITYRFKDLSGKPLAAVRLMVAFTNSIQDPVPIDPLTDPVAPQFSQLQDILGVSIGGPLMGTLLQAVSKESSYQDLLKSTAETTPQSFASSCNTLETALAATYGLNRFDAALAMGQILSQDTLYLSSKKFYASGCFRTRSVLKEMGITVFEINPPNP